MGLDIKVEPHHFLLEIEMGGEYNRESGRESGRERGERKRVMKKGKKGYCVHYWYILIFVSDWVGQARTNAYSEDILKQIRADAWYDLSLSSTLFSFSLSLFLSFSLSLFLSFCFILTIVQELRSTQRRVTKTSRGEDGAVLRRDTVPTSHRWAIFGCTQHCHFWTWLCFQMSDQVFPKIEVFSLCVNLFLFFLSFSNAGMWRIWYPRRYIRYQLKTQVLLRFIFQKISRL